MWCLAGVGESVLFFLNHLRAEGTARHAAIRGVATGSMYALAAIPLYLIWKKPDRTGLLRDVLWSGFSAFLIGKTLNQVIARDRPFVASREDVRHIPLIVRPDSFPTIHAVTAFALVGAVLFSGHRPWGHVMPGLTVPMIAARYTAPGETPQPPRDDAAI